MTLSNSNFHLTELSVIMADGLEDSFGFEPQIDYYENNEADIEFVIDEQPVKKEKTQQTSSMTKNDDVIENTVEGVKKKKKKKKHNFKRRKITEDESIVNCTTFADSRDFLKFHDTFLDQQKLSSIEREELVLNQQTHFKNVANRESIENISQFLEVGLNWTPKLRPAKAKMAQVVIVCSAAMRCIELINVLKKSKTHSCAHISKMFSSHMKIDDQAKELERQEVHICVGTPARLCKLVEEKYLILEICKFFVVDFNWRNSKLKRIVDIPETKAELMKFVSLFGKNFVETKNSIAIF